MMKNFYIGLMLAISTLITAAACSVKEKRDTCPCRMILDFSEVDVNAYADMRVFVSGEAETLCDEYSVPEGFFPMYEILIPRSDVAVNVYSGEEDCFKRGEGIVIPYGEDCPRIFMHSAIVNASGESVRDTVIMHKNHCVVELYIDNDDDLEYDLRVKGNISGYGRDGSPVKGEFSFIPVPDAECRYMVIIPRQVDESLLLEIDDGTEVLKTVSLGKLIAAGGYDWEASDLEDLTVHIDWAMTSVTVAVSGWDWVYESEIVI